MHANICAMTRVWELTHESGCLLRAEYHRDGLLVVEIADGPPGLDPKRWWDEDVYDDAIAATEHDLAKRGMLRTAVASPAAAERELRLITDVIREVV